MSLIVAKREENAIIIVSDTKLTIPAEVNNRFGQRNHQNDGILKSMIINDFSISFAGVVENAEVAVKQITAGYTLKSVLDLLLTVNQASYHQTEFIVATATSGAQIFEIKNGSCESVSSAWIGSLKGFARFQQALTSAAPSVEGQSSMAIESDDGVGNPKLFHKMNQALDQVIEDDEIPEVAGFRISVALNNDKFKYTGYIKSYWSRPFLIGDKDDNQLQNNFISHGNSAEGAYTVNVFTPVGEVMAIGIHVKQGEFGIVFCSVDGGLLKPVTLKSDELDFMEYVADKYQLSPLGITQNAEIKYVNEGTKAFHSKDYLDAIRLYNKGLNVKNGMMTAKFHMAKAQAFFLLGFNDEALVCLNEAIKTDSSLQTLAIHMCNQFRLAYNK